MSMLKLKVEDEKGRVSTLHTVYMHRSDVKSGKARNYTFDTDAEAIEAAFNGLQVGSYTVTVEVTAPNGEIFTPITFTHTK